jgi:hypothetical protein
MKTRVIDHTFFLIVPVGGIPKTRLLVVAAARSGATVLYTENLNHGQKLIGVTIVNPFT